MVIDFLFSFYFLFLFSFYFFRHEKLTIFDLMKNEKSEKKMIIEKRK